MAAFSAFSTLDALNTITTSVPDWNRRLDELNSQIALRQIELARLTENDRPPTRSLRNKGSTESLRPRDGEEENHDLNLSNPFDTPPKSDTNGTNTSPSAAARSAAVITPPLHNSRPSPIELSRKPSQKTPPMQTRFGIRKRKTESMVSTESQVPKYRTRSMIIVYYDSAVQTAFEDLVKFVSASRNSMRKGKMNAKMEAMRRAAERETEDEAADDALHGLITNGGSLPRPQKSEPVGEQGKSATTPGSALEVEIDQDDDVEMDIPRLQFRSTRNMGPPRSQGNYGVSKPDHMGSAMGLGMLGRNARSAAGAFEITDIFDELDKGLEWCQGQCERAAHQFLRDGDCSDEIEAIKKRLLDVRERAEKEAEKLKKEEAKNPTTTPRREISKSRELRSPQMRKAIGTMKASEPNKKPDVEKKDGADNSKLEVDKMEVDDDEGYEDVELPPMMTYRRTRDMGH